jgi:hypothetical protein
VRAPFLQKELAINQSQVYQLGTIGTPTTARDLRRVDSLVGTLRRLCGRT